MIYGSQHKGQVALILVLIMTVASALAVSLASRSTVDTRIQQTESESMQALLFAQTGLEQLVLNPGSTTVGAPNTNYYAVTSDVGTDSLIVGLLKTGSTVDVNLVGATNLSGLAVYWGPENGSPLSTPAVLISLIESSGKITDYAFDYSGLNGFTPALAGDVDYPKTTGTLTLNGNEIDARITVLGSAALLKIVPIGFGALFPAQIKSSSSIGSVQSDANAVKYGLRYEESSIDSSPTVFDYALFSGGSIIQ